MRATRILASVVAVVALGAIAAAPAAASKPEFNGEVYPYHLVGKQLNIQGFGDSLAAIASSCETATASTEVEGLANPAAETAKITAHPTYGKETAPTGCVLSLLTETVNGESKINTEGCQYQFTAAVPGTKVGTALVTCGKQATVPTAGNCKVTTVVGATCEIKIEAGAGLPAGCLITVPPQLTKGIEYVNEGATKVKINAEVGFEIKTNINSNCGTGKSEAKSGYREGIIASGKTKLASAGKPASFVTETEAKTGIEVAANEAHWYENHVGLAAQSGGAGEEGNDVLVWGKVNLASTEVGTTNCQVVGAGDLYNAGGSGNAFGLGNAAAGQSKIDAFHPFDCEEKVGELCETAHAEKLSVEPEGLEKGGEWEAKLNAVSPVRQSIGNKTGGSPTQIKLSVVCGTGANYTAKWTGQLEPELEPGSKSGSLPAKLQFNSGSLEAARTLPTGGSETGSVTNNVKMMGFEGEGGIISTKNP